MPTGTGTAQGGGGWSTPEFSKTEVEVLESFLAAGQANHGKDHPQLLTIERELELLRQDLLRRIALNPPPI